MLVAEAIESVLAQTNPNWELIVVDDASTDNTWEVLESYAAKDERIRVFKRDREPKGAPTCRNIGAGLANGEYLIFLDSDDILKPFCVGQRLDTIKDFPELDLAVFNTAMVDKDLQKTIRVVSREVANPLLQFIKQRSAWVICSVLWRKEAFEAIKGFNESYLRFQDTEIHARALITISSFKTFLNLPVDSLYRINHQERFIEREPFLLIESYLKFYCDFYNLLPISHREKVVEMDPLFVFFFREKCLYQHRSYSQARKVVKELKSVGTFTSIGSLLYNFFIFLVKIGADKPVFFRSILNSLFFNRFSKKLSYGLGLKPQKFY